MAQSTYTPDELAEEPKELDATPARQGMKGAHVVVVLVVSFVLALAGMLLAWAYHSGGLAGPGPQGPPTAERAQQFDQPEPAARQNYQR